MKQKFDIVIADDHALLREGLRSFLQDAPWARIVGEVNSAQALYDTIDGIYPDVVVMDPCLPGGDGAACIKHVRDITRQTKVVVLTDKKEEEWMLECIRAGADGYILKTESSDDVLAGVKSVLEGKQHLSAQILMDVAHGYLLSKQQDAPTVLMDALTKREHEVFDLVGQKFKNREIAAELFISIKTVEKHRASMMRKLRLKRAVDVRRLWAKLNPSSDPDATS